MGSLYPRLWSYAYLSRSILTSHYSLNTRIDGNPELCKNVDFCLASPKEHTEKKKSIVPIVAGVSASAIFVIGVGVYLVWAVKARKRRTVQSVAQRMTNVNL